MARAVLRQRKLCSSSSGVREHPMIFWATLMTPIVLLCHSAPGKPGIEAVCQIAVDQAALEGYLQLLNDVVPLKKPV